MLDLKDNEFDSIKEYIYKNYGIKLGADKKSLVYSRLRTLIAELELDSFTEYYNYLVKDKTGKASADFINRITTNHTFFMRENEHFDFLYKTVLPEINKRNVASKDIRVWCAGCSSGEEAYTLQILIQEYFKDKPGWNTQLLASDVSTKVLNIAYNGVYSAESLEGMPKGWVKNYFVRHSDNFFIVKDTIKSQIFFRKINLMDDNLESKFSKKFDVIFCRNVMIYFDDASRDNLAAKFYNMNEQGGYLFVGHSERLNHLKTQYKYVIPAVYRK